MTSLPGTARKEHLHPLISQKKEEKKTRHGLHLAYSFSLPYSKLKPYVPSRISKIDLCIFNTAV